MNKQTENTFQSLRNWVQSLDSPQLPIPLELLESQWNSVPQILMGWIMYIVGGGNGIRMFIKQWVLIVLLQMPMGRSHFFFWNSSQGVIHQAKTNNNNNNVNSAIKCDISLIVFFTLFFVFIFKLCAFPSVWKSYTILHGDFVILLHSLTHQNKKEIL